LSKLTGYKKLGFVRSVEKALLLPTVVAVAQLLIRKIKV